MRQPIAALAAAITAAAALAGGTALAGCSAFGESGGTGGGGGSAAATASGGTSAKVARAETTHEYPAPTPVPETATGGTSAIAADAVRRFAIHYINWTASTVTRQMQVLALASIGQARSAMTLAAAQSANDYELRHGAVANHGVVEALTPLPGHRDQFVVVTRERTTAADSSAYAGLRPVWHVAIAGVTEVAPGQWVVSLWQPES